MFKDWFFGYDEAERKEERLLAELNETLLEHGLVAVRGAIAVVCKNCKNLITFIVNNPSCYDFLDCSYPVLPVFSYHDLLFLQRFLLKKHPASCLSSLRLNEGALRGGDLPPHELTHRAFGVDAPLIFFNVDIVVVERESERPLCVIEASYPTKTKAVYALRAVGRALNLPAFYLCYTADWGEDVVGFLFKLNDENVIIPPARSELKPIKKVASYLVFQLEREANKNAA